VSSFAITAHRLSSAASIRKLSKPDGEAQVLNPLAWTGDHVCAPELVQAGPPGGLLHGELRRIDPAEELEPMAGPRATELERRPRVRISR
jgi:hypothetical protein